jgi:hypothetical protein
LLSPLLSRDLIVDGLLALLPELEAQANVSDLAHKLAQEAYRSALDGPSLSMAEALRRLHNKTYDDPGHGDTYMAYCWYGDPRACLRLDFGQPEARD